MAKLLIIADDFTGALDTGVQFASKGIKTKVVIYDSNKKLIEKEDNDINVLVVDAETRHLVKEKAYDIVYDIVKKSKKENIKFLYKKTDSALRGNIGSELAAVLEASNENSLPFIPAFPKMNRITKNGIHYIDNTPVNESVFGQDPFEPVKYSSVKKNINSQNKVKVVEIHHLDEVIENKNGILIYDAQRENDLVDIAQHLKDSNKCTIMAGCAGFAAVLPKILNLSGNTKFDVNLYEKLLVVCGSVNPITKRQLEYGEKCGFKRIHLMPKQKLTEQYWSSKEGLNQIHQIKIDCTNNDCFIIDSNDRNDRNETFDYAKSKGMSIEQARKSISETIGFILKKILDEDINSTLLVTGGDTLLGFMKTIGIKELVPIYEIALGCVLTQLEYNGKKYNVISKSGGFGSNNLLENIVNLLKNKEINKNDVRV